MVNLGSLTATAFQVGLFLQCLLIRGVELGQLAVEELQLGIRALAILLFQFSDLLLQGFDLFYKRLDGFFDVAAFTLGTTGLAAR